MGTQRTEAARRAKRHLLTAKDLMRPLQSLLEAGDVLPLRPSAQELRAVMESGGPPPGAGVIVGGAHCNALPWTRAHIRYMQWAGVRVCRLQRSCNGRMY